MSKCKSGKYRNLNILCKKLLFYTMLLIVETTRFLKSPFWSKNEFVWKLWALNESKHCCFVSWNFVILCFPIKKNYGCLTNKANCPPSHQRLADVVAFSENFVFFHEIIQIAILYVRNMEIPLFAPLNNTVTNVSFYSMYCRAKYVLACICSDFKGVLQHNVRGAVGK